MTKTNRTDAAAGAVRVGQDGKTRVEGLVIGCPEVAAYLSRFPDQEREARFVGAVEVGVACLERATTACDLDFVRRQIQEQIRVVTAQMEAIPARLEEQVRKQIGVGNGQVLAPVAAVVATTEKVLKDRLAAVQDLLVKDIDPSKSDGKLGRVLGTIAALLDPKRHDSVQGSLEAAVKTVSSADGNLVTVLRKTLEAGLKPLRDEVDRLGKEIRSRDAVTAALQATPVKGMVFEEELLPTLQCWAKFAGARVAHVGGDNQPGDIVVTLTDAGLGADEFSIVIEARDDQAARGAKRVGDDIGAAMKLRKAQAGLYISRSRTGLAREVGDWYEGKCSHGPFVACPVEHLITAIRFTIVNARLRALLAIKPGADASVIEQEVARIRTAIRRLRTIKTRASEVRKGADSITRETEELQQELAEALTAIENAINGVAQIAA